MSFTETTRTSWFSRLKSGLAGLIIGPLLVLGMIWLLSWNEGRSVQTLHVGSYDDEGPTLARLHDEFMPGEGLRFNGRHHEVYLGDPRRTAPEKLRTILRQPVAPA